MNVLAKGKVLESWLAYEKGSTRREVFAGGEGFRSL